MDERDEVHEALTGTVRTGAMVLAQIAAQVTRAGEARAADDARRAERDARELQDRATAARDAARLSYGQVTDPAWWDRARPEQIGDAYAAATAWRGTDPVAGRAVPVFERELRDRYGIDPADIGAAAPQDKAQQPTVRTSAAGEAVTGTAMLDALSAVDGAQAAGHAAAAARIDRDTAAGIAQLAPSAATERAAQGTADTVGVVLGDAAVTSASAAPVRAATGGQAAAAAPAVAGAVTAGRDAQANEAATAPVAPTAERDRLKRRLEQAGQDLPVRAVEARLTAAYGEGRPARDIQPAAPAVPSMASAGLDQVRLRLGQHR